MNSRIREAFDAVRAEEALKDSTRLFLAQRAAGGRARRSWWAGQRLAPVVRAAQALVTTGPQACRR